MKKKKISSSNAKKEARITSGRETYVIFDTYRKLPMFSKETHTYVL